uniref:Uncharacterized protein n=1 Tax=Micrurus lemniscatus lemniscatus TaxID=129467 RepID=A0A2D4HPG6_MICLE
MGPPATEPHFCPECPQGHRPTMSEAIWDHSCWSSGDHLAWERSESVVADGLSESALQQAVAAAARGTDFLGAEPFHHVAGVASVATGQTEVGRAPHGHVADGTLEGKAFADGTLNATHFAVAVAAEDTKLNSLMRLGGAGNKLEDFGSFLSQAPAIQDLSVALFKVVKLLCVGRIQKPFVPVMLVSLSVPRISIRQVPKAKVVRRRFGPA